MKNPSYQMFLKETSAEIGLVDSKKPHLFTHLEIATLFYLTCAKLYLEKNGVIAFVMPATIIAGDQHAPFRGGKYTGVQLGFKKLIDLHNVEPLFNVQACVLESQYEGRTKYPLDGVIISGTLTAKNSTLKDATKQLHFKNTKFSLESLEGRSFLHETIPAENIVFSRSSYFDAFREGATIVPRPFWFVDIVKHPTFSANPEEPFVKTGLRAKEKGKKQYADVDFEGQIESRFLYRVVTGSEMIPFGLLDTNLTILPIEPSGDKYRIVEKNEAERRAFPHLAKWLGSAEKTWAEKRESKLKGPTIYKWIDYRRKLTEQSSKKRYVVLYEAVGTYLVATVVDKRKTLIETPAGKVNTTGTLIDYSTIYYETNDSDEAQYLCAIFNSKTMDDLIKPMQATGLFGPRNIWKKVLELPITKFNPKNELHSRLAELGKECERTVQRSVDELSKQHNIGKIRSLVRKSLAKEIEEITDLTTRLLTRESRRQGLSRFSE